MAKIKGWCQEVHTVRYFIMPMICCFPFLCLALGCFPNCFRKVCKAFASENITKRKNNFEAALENRRTFCASTMAGRERRKEQILANLSAWKYKLENNNLVETFQSEALPVKIMLQVKHRLLSEELHLVKALEKRVATCNPLRCSLCCASHVV